MELTEKEKMFLYDVLDQISVRGLEQKKMTLNIMVMLAEEMQENPQEADEKD